MLRINIEPSGVRDVTIIASNELEESLSLTLLRLIDADINRIHRSLKRNAKQMLTKLENDGEL